MLPRSKPFYTDPRFQFGAGAVLLLICLLILYQDDLWALYAPFERAAAEPGAGLGLDRAFGDAILSFVFALVLPFVARELFYRLVSQFVLPVRTPEERRHAMDQFLSYTSGLTGPLVFVKDGKLIAKASEKGGPPRHSGVAWINSASCLVLRTDTAFTRVVGPGVAFMRGGEYPTDEGALDLRLQVRTLPGVAALTRDGIALTLDIAVTFILDSGEGHALRDWADPSRPPYGFNARSAMAAVYAQPFREGARGLWAELPPLVAADVLREELMARDFESLFSASDSALPLLATLQYQVEKRLTGALAATPAREQQLLSERGVRVVGVRFANLRLPEDVRKKRIANWREDWKSRAGEMAADKDPAIRQAKQQGQDDGRLAVLNELTRPLAAAAEAGAPPNRKAIASLLAEATRRLIQDPALQSSTAVADAKRLLEDLELWVKGWRER